jgi:GNAT superfamily N-acetyltransferase
LSSEIRAAKVEDLPRLVRLAEQFYASSRFLQGFKLERFCATWSQLIESGVGGICLAEDGGDLVGALGGVAYPDPNSGDLVATEFFWFVDPHRRGCGLRLYREFEAWARRLGCSQIRMVHLVDSMPDQLERLYTRLGYEKAEVHFVKGL